MHASPLQPSRDVSRRIPPAVPPSAVLWKSSYLLPRMLALAVLSVLPLVLLHAYTLYTQYHRAEEATYRAVLGQVELAARTADNVLDRAEAQLQLIARRRQAQQGDAMQCAALLQTLIHDDRLVVRFDVHGASGALACTSADADTETAATHAPWVPAVLYRHGAWLSEPFLATRDDATRRTHVVRLALAVQSFAARGTEVVSALVDLAQLSESLSPAALPPGSVLSLYDTDGRILARNPDFQQWVGRTMPTAMGDEAAMDSALNTAMGVDGVRRLYARSRLQRQGLHVFAGVPTAAITGPLRSEVTRSVLVALLVLGAGLGLAAYWSSIAGRSLRQLAQAAADLAGGRQGVRIDTRLPGELGALAAQFNLMLEALHTRTQALESSQRRAVRLSQLNEALSATAHAAVRKGDPEELFGKICRICVETGQARVAWICVAGRPVAVAMTDELGPDAALPRALIEGDARSGRGQRWHARCTGDDLVVENDVAGAAELADIRPLLLERGIQSATSLPFSVRGRHVGNLNLYADTPGFFDQDAVRLLQAISAELAFALEAHEVEQARLGAERALAQREQQLAGIIDTAMDAIITVDASHRIVVFNRAAAEMFKVEAEQAIGGTLERLIPLDARARHGSLVDGFAQEPLAQRRHGGTAMRFRGLRSTGEEFPIEAMLIKLGSGDELLMTAVLRDVSAFEKAEAARQAEARAEMASRAKTEFISHMSHELRTPLNAVLGFSQLLQGTARERLTHKELQQLDMVFLAGAQLRSLIEEALDLSRIEAGRVELRMEAVDLCALVHELMLLLEPLAQEQGVRLVSRPEGGCSLHVHADSKRLRQVLLNILSNAIKYNRRGGTVTAALREAGDQVELEVSDTGMGMTPRQLESLFEPFNRLGRELSGIEGTGIGMALTRKLVELLGGSLSVSSEEEVGTTVRLVLPRVKAQPPPAVEPPAVARAVEPGDAAEPHGRILYVEDNPVNVILVEAMLAHWRGIELVSAPDVDSGVRLATALQPDLVLLDMHLGTSTGHEFLARVRGDSRTAALRVVALSASAMPHEVQAARQAGVMDYWTKPLDAATFQAGITRLLAVHAGGEAG
jgi:PAS domain S-box-containing protein